MSEYRKISKKELFLLLDTFSDDEEFTVIQTELGMSIIPLGQKKVKKEEVASLASKAKTMIYSDNKFLHQVDMHSTVQNIYDIKKVGMLNTLLVPKINQTNTNRCSKNG